MFRNIEEIRAEFGLTGQEPDRLRRELKKMLFDLHPDKNDGVFSSESDQEEFYKLTEAISFLSQSIQPVQEQSNHLISVQEAIELIRTVERKEIVSQEKEEQEQKRVQEQERKSEQLSNKLKLQYRGWRNRRRVPPVSLSVVTAIITFLWLLPDQLSGNKITNTLVYGSDQFYAQFTVVWLLLLLLTVWLWLFCYFKEQSYKRIMDRLKLEVVQDQFFNTFPIFENFKYLSSRHSPLTPTRLQELQFTKKALIEHIRGSTYLLAEPDENVFPWFFKHLSAKGRMAKKMKKAVLHEYEKKYRQQPYTRKEFAEEVNKRLMQHYLNQRYRLDDMVTQELADIILLRAQQRGIIQEAEQVETFSSVYEFIPKKAAAEV